MTIKVFLRNKVISDNRYSLYLDFYPAIIHPKTGKETRREFLGLYVLIDKDEIRKQIRELKKKEPSNSKEAGIIKNKIKKLNQLSGTLSQLSPIDKKHNLETHKIAESIRQKRENHLNKPEIYSEFEKKQLEQKKKGEINFIKYFRELADKKDSSNRSNWLSAINYLIDFAGEDLKFSQLNEKLFNDFKEYLNSANTRRSDKIKLSQNSALSYFNKAKAALRQAYKDDILLTDLNSKISPIKEKETRREYLTIEELNSLVKAPCEDEVIKKAAIFSALTGLAFADIQKLLWGDIEFIKGQGYIIKYSRKKTGRPDDLPISEQAYSLLGEPGETDQMVFNGLKYSAFNNKILTNWIVAAGIKKKATFHIFRHTFATLQLANGTDITTVQKMLNHKNINTTMIYAKVVDRAKREAANKIKLDL